MGEAFKELGKSFFTTAVVILVASIIQPWVKGKVEISVALTGAFLYVFLIISGFTLIVLGEKFNRKKEE